MKFNIVVSVLLGCWILSPLWAAAWEDDYPWGRIELVEGAAEFHLINAADYPELEVPRFQNPVVKVYLKSDPQQQALRLKPGVSTWQIKLPKKMEGRAVIVMETVGPPRFNKEPMLYRPNKEGELVLPAHGAVVHGEKLRYEPQPHKNTVGYWQNEKDWCEWNVSLPAQQKYDVYILQGCGEGQGGSTVQVIAGDQKLEFAVEDTGHFQNFKERYLGRLLLMPDRADSGASPQTIKLVPIHKAKGAVMDVRQLRLVPVPDSGFIPDKR